MPPLPTVHRCRTETAAIIKGRSDLTVEYLDTSTEVERYLDPSTIRSLHRTSTTCDCRPRRTCPAIGSHLWCGRHAPWANWQAHICTCEHITCGSTRFVCSWTHYDLLRRAACSSQAILLGVSWTHTFNLFLSHATHSITYIRRLHRCVCVTAQGHSTRCVLERWHLPLSQCLTSCYCKPAAQSQHELGLLG